MQTQTILKGLKPVLKCILFFSPLVGQLSAMLLL